ncbi:MAG: hemolysin family protein [Promicromonosporaceae bacterium]|nr:hemolysin family protein [Promicromonosporaceae bacterium]
MIAILLVLVVSGFTLAGLLSAGEAAVLRVTKTSLADAFAEAKRGAGLKAETRANRAKAALALAQHPAVTVAAIAVVRIAAQLVAIGALTLLLDGLIDDQAWEALPALLVIGLLAGLLLARWSPRGLGHKRPVSMLLSLSALLTATCRLTGWAVRRPVSSETLPHDAATEVELRDLVDRVEESEVLAEDDRELLRSAAELGGTLTREVMVPRTDIVTASAELSLSGTLRLFLRSGFSRVPVIGGSVDDLRGIAYLKDVARHIDEDAAAAERPISDFARAVVYVPESKPIDDLLREMQAKATHVAIVIDEYGGVAGLVTVEDVLEELVGELVDEHDHIQEIVSEQVADGVFRVSARLPVDELGDLFNLRFDDDEIDTAGGLLAKALGKVPLVGSQADIGGLHLLAETIEGRRKQVATILVSLTTPLDDKDTE